MEILLIVQHRLDVRYTKYAIKTKRMHKIVITNIPCTIYAVEVTGVSLKRSFNMLINILLMHLEHLLPFFLFLFKFCVS